MSVKPPRPTFAAAGVRAILGLPAALLVGAALLLAVRPSVPGFVQRETPSPAPFPASLASTGLYADFAAKTVDPGNLAYSPQYPLWSDGATKRRWIRLPPGTAVDAKDPDVWIFPAGTKIWKEFSFGGKRVETRLIESLGGGVLRFAAYAWNTKETEATLAPSSGLRDFVEIAPGVRHNIPGVYDCRACHHGRADEVLGFSALQLSPDRDPEAPHAEAVTPGMADLASIIARGRLVHAPPSWAERPLRIRAAAGTARAALGTMHANCGNCHNVNTPLVARGLVLRYSVAPGVDGAAGVLAAIGEPSSYPVPGVAPGQAMMIAPAHPERSAVVYRMSTRNPLRQMPPLGTKIVDREAVELITRWIREGAAADSRREP
jgi:hypothetical protein